MRIVRKEHLDLRARTLKYSARIARLCAALPEHRVAQIISSQLFRSGSSVGAHVAEANRAKSRADFISKMEGGLQEIEETRYWMDLLVELRAVDARRLEPLLKETEEITSILVAMVSRSRNRK